MDAYNKMAATFHHVLTVLVLFCVCVNTLPITQDNKQTNTENSRVLIRNKRSEVTSNFCLDKNEIWFHKKCRSLKEYQESKDGTIDYKDSPSAEILNITETEESVEDNVTYTKTNAASESTTFETTHHEATEVPSSTDAKEVQTVHQLDTTVSTATSSTKILDKFRKHRKLKDETRNYDDFLTTNILNVTGTGQVVEDNVTYNKTSAVSEPNTFETTHQEATKVTSSTVAKEVQTVYQLDTTVSTSTSSTKIPDKVNKHQKSKDETRSYDDFLTTKILNVIGTGQVVEDNVAYIKTRAVSKPNTFETTYHEATKVPSSTVAKEVQTVYQLDSTVSTSSSSTKMPDEVQKLDMKISTFIWIFIGCAVFVALCFIFVLYWYCCLRKNKDTTSNSLRNPENNNNHAEAAMLLKTIDVRR